MEDTKKQLNTTLRQELEEAKKALQVETERELAKNKQELLEA